MVAIDSGGRSEGGSAHVAAAFRSNYRQYQYEFVEFFTEHLSDLSRVFSGDLQMVLTLAVVGQIHLRNLMDQQSDEGAIRTAPGIAASRLADVTGIPRETIRRKLAALEKLGWIERVDRASWRIASSGQKSVARDALSEVDARAIDRIARLFCRLERIARTSTAQR